MNTGNETYAVLTHVFDLTDPDSKLETAAVVCIDARGRGAYVIGRWKAFLPNPFGIDPLMIVGLAMKGEEEVEVEDLMAWLQARLTGSFSLGASKPIQADSMRNPFTVFKAETGRDADFAFWIGFPIEGADR